MKTLYIAVWRFYLFLDKLYNMLYDYSKEWKMLKRYECLRCNHKWIPRKDGTPVVCPKCHNPYWNIKKMNKEVVNGKDIR
jgi:rubrerythrin